MSRAADPAPGRRSNVLRQLPSVDQVLAQPRLVALAAVAGRALVADAVRDVLDRLRYRAAQQPDVSGFPGLEAVADEAAAEASRWLAPSLRTVINATGVILHTNLGRAPLARQAVDHVRATAGEYTNLEYDLAAGCRGSRDVHTARLLARLAGAEAAIVVNNNAAAVLLVLAALARGGEVVVSRGELIEIGESFRIPDIMAESGAMLREIGTTNRTALDDYERAINERTRLLLRVHRSNFRIVGFADRPALADLAALGGRANIPVYEDLGSGCLMDLSAWGVAEPVVSASFDAGADLVSFSGDKLLGGPQAGVIAGRRDLIERIRRQPLFRALRVDKLVIAALKATLAAYLREDLDAIPALRMVRFSAADVRRRAERLLGELRPMLAADVHVELADGESVIGGGSTPEEHLPTCLLEITAARWTAAQIEARLRTSAEGSAVVARVARDCLLLDLRTVLPEQESALAAALVAALR